MANGSTAYLGIAVETVGGTALAPTKYLPVKSVDFPAENTFINVKESRGSRQASQTYAGAVKPTATFKTGFYGAGAFGVLLKGLFGGVATTAISGATTSKLHTFSDAANLPYLTLERADAKAGAGGFFVERLGGCKVESLAITCNFGADVDVDVSLQALRWPDATVTAATTPVFPTYNPYIFTGASVSIDGSASTVFTNLKFDFKNTLTRQDALNGTRESVYLFEGGLDCTLTGQLIFNDITMYNKFNTNALMNIIVSFTGDSLESGATPPTFYKSTWQWTQVQLSKYSAPFTAGNITVANATFNIKFDNGAGRAIQATLQNADTAGSYAT